MDDSVFMKVSKCRGWEGGKGSGFPLSLKNAFHFKITYAVKDEHCVPLTHTLTSSAQTCGRGTRSEQMPSGELKRTWLCEQNLDHHKNLAFSCKEPIASHPRGHQLQSRAVVLKLHCQNLKHPKLSEMQCSQVPHPTPTKSETLRVTLQSMF